MTDTETLVAQTAERLFADQCTRAVLEAADRGIWPGALWQALEGAGLTMALVAEDAPERLDVATAAVVLRAAGRFSAPVPIAETMLAGWILSCSGAEPPAGPLTFAPVRQGDAVSLTLADGRLVLSGQVRGVPWARQSVRIVVLVGDAVALVDPTQCRMTPGRSYAGEPRDDLAIDDLPLDAAAVIPAGPGVDGDRLRLLGALTRTVMMAGALERVLDLCTTYANERVQFGRPIGRFQAIQHYLAVLASEVAASDMAAKAAVAATTDDDPTFAIAAAKVRVGEAAGKVAAIAHQVHGAIGFTHEHALHHSTRRLWSWRDEFGRESEWTALLGRRIAAAGADSLWPMITAN